MGELPGDLASLPFLLGLSPPGSGAQRWISLPRLLTAVFSKGGARPALFSAELCAPTRFLAAPRLAPLPVLALRGSLCAPCPFGVPPFLSRPVCSRTAVFHVTSRFPCSRPASRPQLSGSGFFQRRGVRAVCRHGAGFPSPSCEDSCRVPAASARGTRGTRRTAGCALRAPSGPDVCSVSVRFGGYASGSRPGNLYLPESQRCSLLFSSRSSVVSAFVLGLRSAAGRCSRVSAGVYICGVEIN